MRRQLTLLVAAITAMVVVAFLIPLALLVRDVAEDRALTAAELDARSLAPVLAAGVDAAALEVAVAQIEPDRRITVFLPSGTTVGADSAAGPSVALAQQGRAFSATAPGGREILVPVQIGGGTAVVRAFVGNGRLHAGVTEAWVALGALGLGLLLLAVLVADRLARSMVRAVTALAETAHELTGGDLDARVDPAGPPEVAEVGGALNRLAGRIGELLTAERESVADLSHRLRTPVTALRLDSEGLRDPAEAARLGADVDALERAVDQVIREARRPVREGVGAATDLVGVTRERVAFWGALAEDQGRSYELDLPAGALPVRVPYADLAAALDALLGNVFAHTPEGTAFAVRVGPDGTLTVSDEGPGLADPRAVERGVGSGTGLGLDIVRRTAEAAGGSVSVESPGGVRVTVRLPLWTTAPGTP